MPFVPINQGAGRLFENNLNLMLEELFDFTDAVTATPAEINVLDGITASVTELNYTDGVTSAIQTQLDGKQQLGGSSEGNATTSGTSVTVTGIPSGVRSIIVTLGFVSTNGTAPIRLQLGSSGGLATSGYSVDAFLVAASGNTDISSSTGFPISGVSSGGSYTGFIHLERSGATRWHASYVLRNPDLVVASGTVAPAAELDRVALVTDGVDTFDAGFFDVVWRY